MLAERRRRQPIQWSVILAVIIQTVILAYSYGKLAATVADNVERLTRIEQLIDAGFKR